MSELPAGWTEACVGDLADLNPKQAFDDETIAGFVPMSHAPTNFLDKLRFEERPWGEIKKAYTNFKDGDVIFAKVTPCFENGKAAYVEGLPNGIGAGSSEFFVLRPSCDQVSAKYLLALVKSHDFLREGAENMTGAVGLRRVPKQFVESYPVQVPPAAEQTRIAAKLDELLAQVDTLKARIDGIPALLKRFRQSVLAAAVSGRLTEEWRLKDPLPLMTGIQLMAETADRKRAWSEDNESHNEVGRVRKRLSEFAAKHMSQNDLPSSWCWAELEDVSLLVVDCHNKTAPYEKDGIPLVRTSNIRDGSFLWADLRYVNEETYRFWSRRCTPEPGDIVFTREAPMGEAAIIPAGKMICLGQRTMLIRCIPECTSAEFVLLALRDPKFKARSEKLAVGTGVKHYRVGDVSDLLIPVPPKTEQTEIVRRVEQLFAFADQLEARVKAAQVRIDRLTQSILAKAFRGELVPQDPNDEPASVLLERIKAQRAAAPKAKRGRRAATLS